MDTLEYLVVEADDDGVVKRSDILRDDRVTNHWFFRDLAAHKRTGAVEVVNPDSGIETGYRVVDDVRDDVIESMSEEIRGLL